MPVVRAPLAWRRGARRGADAMATLAAGRRIKHDLRGGLAGAGVASAVGGLRALDLLRAMLGLAPSGPERERSEASRIGWSRGALLDLDSVHHVSPSPGIILLDPGAGDARPNIVWAEACDNVRERLDEMLRQPQDDAALEELLGAYPRRVIFHVLVVHDPERRARLLRSLRAVLARRRAEPANSAVS